MLAVPENAQEDEQERWDRIVKNRHKMSVFAQEFEELGILGKGTFGTVFLV